jgi:cytochrome c553
VAACFGCHAIRGHGNGARFPSIAGQPASFTAERLHEFQARAKNGAAKPGTMTAVAAQMTDAQIEAAGAYLSTLSRRSDIRTVMNRSVFSHRSSP